jgi:hypothetical protein
MMGVPLLPKNSGVIGKGVIGDMIIGSDYTPIPDLIDTYKDHPYVQIELYTAAFVLCGVVDNYKRFSYTANWQDLDTWEIEINRYKTNVSRFVAGGFIRFTSDSSSYIGIIESIEKPLDDRGKGGETWVISGRGIESIFAQRICMAGTAASTGYTAYSNKAETVMRAIVNNECISAADANRNITGLSLAANDLTRGATVDRSLRFEYLNDVLYGICKETGLSFRFVQVAGLTFILTFYTGTDVSATVKITPDYGNVAAFKYIESLLEMKNLLYVGGTGAAAARVVRECYTGTEPAGWSRREKFIDASDCSSNALVDARGAETLATTGESVTLDVEYLESPTYTLGTHFKLGDIITVLFVDVATVVSRITAITYEWTADSGKKITLGIGKGAPDLVSIMKLDRRLGGAQQRR